MQYKQSVEVIKTIETSTDKVWDIISEPGHLELVHPFAKSHTVTTWPGPESKDILVYLSGLRYEREFLSWEEGKGYSLKIGGKNSKKSKVIWKISPDVDNASLSITIYPHFLANTPKLISLLPYKFLINPKLKSYLNSVLSGINYYAVEQKPVPKNHFGNHKWFS